MEFQTDQISVGTFSAILSAHRFAEGGAVCSTGDKNLQKLHCSPTVSPCLPADILPFTSLHLNSHFRRRFALPPLPARSVF